MLEKTASLLWGPFTILGILCVGVYYTVRSRFFPIRKCKTILERTLFAKDVDKSRGISPLSSLFTALSGCIGVGNIIGVSAAIYAGGYGAVVWMCVSAFFGMMIKYAEISLAMRFRQKTADGYVGSAVGYLKFGLKSPILATLYTVSGFGASLATGNLIQSNTIATVVNEQLHISPLVCAVVLCTICAILSLGGIKRISAFLSRFMPFAIVIFIFSSLLVIFININSLPYAISKIFKSAFNFKSAGGGMLGSCISAGFSKGILSNESGVGTSAVAHCASSETVPERQAMWGILEVFIDTILLCSLTALTLAVTDSCNALNTVSSAVIYSFSSSLGVFGRAFLTFSLISFAFSTLLAWSYYGSVYWSMISSKKYVYYPVFLICIALGAQISVKNVWAIADILNCTALIPNMIGLICLSNTVLSGLKKEENVT